MKEDSNQYGYCPICGKEWENHNNITCFRKNMLSYIRIADDSKVGIMAKSFDDLIEEINQKPQDSLTEQISLCNNCNSMTKDKCGKIKCSEVENKNKEVKNNG